VVYDGNNKELKVVAIEDIQRGEQIFIDTFFDKENPTFLHQNMENNICVTVGLNQ
jgi:hypothetical protein